MVSISGIMNVGKQAYKYGKIVLNASPELAFGTSAEKVGKAMRTAAKSGASLKATAKAGLKVVEKFGKGNFLSNMWKNLTHLVPDISRTTKAGVRLARIKGSGKVMGALKGLGKGIGKKLPFVFAAIQLIGEIPNIVTATKEKGLWQGIKETAKPIAKLAGAGVGAAIGSAILPGFGSIIGWFAGDWLAGKIVGKSYTEQKAQEEEKRSEVITQLQQEGILPAGQDPATLINPGLTPEQNPQQQVNPNQPVAQQPTGTNPYYPYAPVTNPFGPMNPLSMNGTNYQDDIMMQNLPFNVVC